MTTDGPESTSRSNSGRNQSGSDSPYSRVTIAGITIRSKSMAMPPLIMNQVASCACNRCCTERIGVSSPFFFFARRDRMVFFSSTWFFSRFTFENISSGLSISSSAIRPLNPGVMYPPRLPTIWPPDERETISSLTRSLSSIT
ncbi:hypothetical protein KPP2020_031 [Klebsiella phage KPP2020]|uniref:Uncharacterized protein n=1 Tax=Klebsiella phage KPP2020 TaxID=3017288 RepID=A0AAE9YEL8_9CAUD|nr:hypothetical protein KPP2020_031 [Klebsiella phage KPP2020]